MALTSRSKELTQDIMECMNIMDEYRGRGHQETSISLLDFSCRYDDGPMKAFEFAKQCRICHKSPMVKSKKIPCGHEFCRGCVWTHFIAHNEDECPVCNQEWNESEVADFVYDDDHRHHLFFEYEE
eukprot:UN12902